MKFFFILSIQAACQELRSSRLFQKVLGAVLNFGNMMSINTGSPNSHALEPNTLLKIVDVKGADGKAALLQFVVQEIMKPEGHNNLNPACKTDASTSLPYDVGCRKHGLQVVSKLAAELTSTKKATSVDITGLSRSVSELGIDRSSTRGAATGMPILARGCLDSLDQLSPLPD